MDILTYTDLDRKNEMDNHYRSKWQRRKSIHLENGDAAVYVFYLGDTADVVIERQHSKRVYNRITPASFARLTNVCQLLGQNISLAPAWFVPTGVR